MSAAYLEKLNLQQRRAVEHGVQRNMPATPLLVIAGAGSGKTNTLAHRVAHLIVTGADARRILLMTFSRRAAAEMTRRVQRIAQQLVGKRADLILGGLTWAGTFHAVGARLLREFAEQIGLSPAFTILDREDAAGLVDLTRHALGFSSSSDRFPRKATCLAIYSRSVNSSALLDEVLATPFPSYAGWEAELRGLFGAYVAAKQKQNVLDYDDLLLYWAQMMRAPLLAQRTGPSMNGLVLDFIEQGIRQGTATTPCCSPISWPALST
jgi:DNA helicase-2/ATP-dependent DNA helicase PcrA